MEEEALVRAGRRALSSLLVSLTGPIGEYVRDRMQEEVQNSVDLSLRSLDRRLKRLEGRTKKRIEDDGELAELLRGWQVVVSRTANAEKLRAAARIVAHSVLDDEDPERVRIEQAEFLMHAIESLSSGALRVMMSAHQLASSSGGVRDGSAEVCFGMLHEKAPAYDQDYLMGLVAELDRFNLLRRIVTPEVTSGKYDDFPIEVTPLGVQLVETFLNEGPDEAC